MRHESDLVTLVSHFLRPSHPALFCPCSERMLARAMKWDVRYPCILKSRPPCGLDVLSWLSCFQILEQVTRWPCIFAEPLKDESYLRVNEHCSWLAVPWWSEGNPNFYSHVLDCPLTKDYSSVVRYVHPQNYVSFAHPCASLVSRQVNYSRPAPILTLRPLLKA